LLNLDAHGPGMRVAALKEMLRIRREVTEPLAREHSAAAADTAYSSAKVLYVATAANIGIAISKFAAGIASGSSSMVAEGIHSVVDTGSELLLLLGNRPAAKPPDTKHPFGHGKALYFWALIAAVCMFVLGGGISIYRGALHLMHPPPRSARCCGTASCWRPRRCSNRSAGGFRAKNC